MTRDDMLALADQLEAGAAINDAYRRAMEQQSARTAGRLDHLAAPSAYGAHGIAAASKRRRAAELRAQAAGPTTVTA
jgi:hypothetical protein